MKSIFNPNNIKIYHITHIENLSSILQENGLWSDAERVNRELSVSGIGDNKIKERRLTWPLTAIPNTHIGDYVPFYFTNRSPMLYRIKNNTVEGYNDGQAPIIYLVSSIASIYSQSLRYCFTDGNAASAITKSFTSLDMLNNEVDWNLINNWSWHKTEDDQDRRRRKQAEFLVHQFCPWSCIEAISVFNQDYQQRVAKILHAFGCKLSVSIEKKWYY